MIKNIFKITSAFLLSMVLVLCTSSAALASEPVTFDDSGVAEYRGSTDVTYRVYSSYTVSIPSTIDQSTNYTGYVEVTMDKIEDGYHVNAYVSNLDDESCVVVTNQNGKRAKLHVNYNHGLITCTTEGLIGSWYPADFQGDNTTASVDVQLSPADQITMEPGNYTGAMCFKVECVQDR